MVGMSPLHNTTVAGFQEQCEV